MRAGFGRARQMEDSAAAAQTIAADPQTQVCGHPEHSACP